MEQNLTTGSVFRNVVRFSLPYLLVYFLQTLYGMADLFIVGQYEGVAATTAVSIGSHSHARGTRHGHHGLHRPRRRGGQPGGGRKGHRQYRHTICRRFSCADGGFAPARPPHHRRHVHARRGRRRHGRLSDHLLLRHPVHHSL